MDNVEFKSIKNEREYFASIDGLRAFAAIGIIMMHVSANGNFKVSNYIFNNIIPFFTNFVFLFMIVSGFSMCVGYYKKIQNREISLSSFYEKRYAKIWPYFALLVFLDLVMSPSLNSLYEAFADLTLCFSLLPNPSISVIGVGWTLGVIFLFYMLFPFFCFLLENKKRAWLSFAIALAFNFTCTKYFFNNAHVISGYNERTNFAFCSMFFIAGGLIYLYREKIVAVVRKYRIGIFFVCTAVTIAYFIFQEIFQKISLSYFFMLAIFSFWLIYAVGVKSHILDNPVTKFLSGISMEIYLCHMVIFRVLEKAHILSLLGDKWYSYILAVLITVGGAIVFALIVKWLLEKLRFIITPKTA